MLKALAVSERRGVGSLRMFLETCICSAMRARWAHELWVDGRRGAHGRGSREVR